jgi:Zn-dependent protease with chaperone function
MIVLFAVVFAHDRLAGSPPTGGAAPSAEPLAVAAGWLSDATWRRDAAAVTLGGCAAIALVTHLLVRLAGRRVDRRGSWRAVFIAESVIGAARMAAVSLFAFAVLALGWLQAVRAWVGDGIAYDELLAMSPPVAVIIAGWWSYFPIDRRLRESALLRAIEEGRPLYPGPSRAGYVVSNIRHQLLLTGVPIALIMAWSEVFGRALVLLDRAADAPAPGALRDAARWLLASDGGDLVLSLAQYAGVLAILLTVPLVVRFAWDTTPLGPGPLRDRLLALCRAERVRVRELLVWRTHGTMVNGAVIGLVGGLRYILLTDSLLDSLPARQVEAVMAHEVAHVRRRHIPWLLAAMIGVMLLVSVAAAWISARPEWRTLAAHSAAWRCALELGLVAAAFAVVVTVLGFVSRRFEWQADAFAAAHLSAAPPLSPGAAAPTVTPEAVAAMAGALQSVATLNHVPRHKFSWRHGSIAHRQNRLAALVGRRVDRLPIDATVRRLKRAAAAALLAGVALTVFAWPALRDAAPPPASLE